MFFSGNGSSESTWIFIQVDSGDEPLPEKHSVTHTLSWWRGGVTGKAFGLAISRSQVQILVETTLRNMQP